jgi:predicted metal-dependent hydrolase
MNKKSAKVAALIEQCRGKDLPAHYLGYFECFNRQLFYEAHDVLEELWLAEGKHGSNYGFYKGLIQFAGAFVHLRKDRLRPAAALFKLSRSYLQPISSPHQRLDVQRLISLSVEWTEHLERSDFTENPLPKFEAPLLNLSPPPTA